MLFIIFIRVVEDLLTLEGNFSSNYNLLERM